MLAHQALGPRRIGSPHGGQQAAVVGQRAARQRPRRGLPLVVLFEQLLEHLHHQREHPVARVLGHQAVELAVQRRHRLPGGPGGGRAGQVVGQHGRQRGGVALDSQAHHGRLDRLPRLVQLVGIQVAAAQQVLERVDRGRAGRLGHKHAAGMAVAHPHQPLELEHPQRLAHPGAADPELGGQDGLGRQPVAGPIPTGEDLAADLRHDTVVGARRSRASRHPLPRKVAFG